MWNVFHYDGAGAYRIPLDRLKAYLERSRSCSLETRFNFRYSEAEWAPEHLEMLRLVIPHIHRCRALHIVADDVTPIDNLVEDLKTASAPLLESLIIGKDEEREDNNPDDAYTQLTPKTVLSGVPALRYLRLEDTTFGKFQPPLTSVVQLRLEKIENLNPPAIIRGALVDEILSLPCLGALSIWGWYIDIPHDIHTLRSQLIHARRLKHCRLDGRYETTVFPYFLSYVSAPSLETLTMVGLCLRDPLIKRDVELFPSLHTLAITRLYIGGTQDLAGNLLDFMNVTKSIRRLVYSTTAALSFVAQHFAFQTLSEDLKEQLQEAWVNVEEVTLNVFSPALEVFRPLASNFRILKILKVSPASLDAIRENEEWAAEWAVLQERVGFSIEAIGRHDPILPSHWPTGSGWFDTKPDPFAADPPIHVSAHSFTHCL